ncbi:MAG: alginate export family protein [Caulobacterales bacterium]
MKPLLFNSALAATLAFFFPLSIAHAQEAAPTITDAIMAGKPIFEVRGRFEGVDQTGIANKGESATLRTRLGWETAEWNSFKALLEFEDVRQIGPEHYVINVPGATTPSLNGVTGYPIINDPEGTELNRLQLTWKPSANFSATGGRQRILIDDQRFIGNVGWRQDEQTFDGVRMDGSLGKFKATYAYLSHINRILGEERDWDSDSHLFNATYALAEPLKLQGFVYALDFSNSAANSSITMGAKASGKTWLSLFQVAYNATYAEQKDYRHNTPDYDLTYYGGDIAATFDIYTAKIGFESLEGNGTRGFTTPLATTHAFQGWADAFVSPGGNKSFVQGIEDLNFTVQMKPRFKFTYLFNPDFMIRYHDFNSERTGESIGSEWDLQATASITKQLSILLKYANFEREAPTTVGGTPLPADREKFWVSFEYKL